MSHKFIVQVLLYQRLNTDVILLPLPPKSQLLSLREEQSGAVCGPGWKKTLKKFYYKAESEWSDNQKITDEYVNNNGMDKIYVIKITD